MGNRDEKALIFFNNSYYETAGWIKVSDRAVPVDGGTRRDSLSEALGVHGEGHYFTLLSEKKSNLWFIRSSKAICENGFFVGLKGYETQVFMDIYEVADDAKGRWARLNNDLEGRGVPDPLAAIKDIFLGDLYYNFILMFDAEIVAKLCNITGASPDLDSLKDLAHDFFITASRFIDGADGAYDPWITLDEEGVSCVFTNIATNKIMGEFEELVTRIAKMKEALEKDSSAKPLLASITDRITKGPLLCAITLGYGLISLLRHVIGKEATGSHAADLAFTHWDLGRKLREIFYKFGATENEAWRIIDIARVVLSKTSLPKQAVFEKASEKFDAEEFAALIIESNYLDEDFRRILGINIFDDVAWFNKEGFEDALFYASLFFMVDGSVNIPIKERVDRIAKIYDVLTKAEKKSGYRLDNLLDSLTSKPVKVSKEKKK
jgi:hypothetical protein